MVETGLETKVTCENRVRGLCPKCREDYSDHYPNNKNCPRYREITLFLVDVGNTELAETKI